MLEPSGPHFLSSDVSDESGNETGASFGVVPASGGTVAPIFPFEQSAYAAAWNWATGTIVFSVEAQQDADPDPEVSNWDLSKSAPTERTSEQSPTSEQISSSRCRNGPTTAP